MVLIIHLKYKPVIEVFLYLFDFLFIDYIGFLDTEEIVGEPVFQLSECEVAYMFFPLIRHNGGISVFSYAISDMSALDENDF